MKRILSLLICMAIVISSVGVVTFADTNHWSYDFIKGMLENGVVSGDQNGNLNLDNLITRAEFAKTINKYFGYTVTADSGFNDVSPIKWYYYDMLIAKGTGYMIGDASGNANPDSYITRAETFVIMARLLGLDDDDSVSFADESDIPSWAKGKIGALVKKGIISGYTDGTIKANGNITRAEAFTVVAKNPRTIIPDNSDATEGLGNTSSMVQINSTPVSVNPGNSGGGGGGGGGGGSAPATPSAFISLDEFSISNYKVQLTVRNAANVTFNYSVEGGGTYPLPATLNTLSGDVYEVDLTSHMNHIFLAEGSQNGKKVTLTSIYAKGISGYSDKTWTPLGSDVKVLLLDVLRDYKVKKVYNKGYTEEGNLRISWDHIVNQSEIDDYAVVVYSDNDFVNNAPAATYIIGDKTKNTFDVPVSTDYTKYNFGITYYFAVVPVKDGMLGVAEVGNSKDQKLFYTKGNGLPEEPYQISNLTHLVNIAKMPDKYYILANDIEGLDKVISTNFTGNLDGNGHSIGLAIDDNTSSNVALFKSATKAVIKNLTLKGFIKTGDNVTRTAGLVAESKSSVFENCKNYAEITAQTTYAAGLVADDVSGVYTNCINYAKITAKGYAGGIVVNTADSVFSGCGNEALITSHDGAGEYFAGIAAATDRSKFDRCYNTGNIVAKERLGGIVALLKYSGVEELTNKYGIHNSYNTGDITSAAGASHIGGLVGICWYYTAQGVEDSPLFSNIFNAGKVKSKGNLTTGLIKLYQGTELGGNIPIYIEGAYDISGANGFMPSKPTTVTSDFTLPVLKSVYITGAARVGETVKSLDEIKALTQSGDPIFSNPELWVAPIAGNSYEYPMIANNKGPISFFSDFKFVSYDDTAKKYNVAWETGLTGATYEVFVNNASQGTTTDKSFAVSVDSENAEVYVEVTVEGEKYTTSKIQITNYIPYNLNVAYNNQEEEYTLTWDSADNDSIVYDIYVDDINVGSTVSNSYVVNLKLLDAAKVNVVATVDNVSYTSEDLMYSDYYPHNLTVTYENGAYGLTWDSIMGIDSFNVYIGQNDPVTTTSNSIVLDFGSESELDVYVESFVNGVTYASDVFTASSELKPYNLLVEYENGTYTLTWDYAIQDVTSFEVYVDDAKLTTTTDRYATIDMADKENVEVYVKVVGTGAESTKEVFTNYVPLNITSSYVNDECVVEWTSYATGATFNVYVDDELYKENITEASCVIDFAGNASANVYVTATYEGTVYYSATQTIINKAPVNLGVSFANGEYVLSWDSDLDGATFEVFVDGVTAGTTPDKELVIDIMGKVSSVYVVATDNDGSYKSATISANGYFAGGSGTETDPYLIGSIDHLNKVNENLTAHYKLVADITDPLTTIIGSGTQQFSGTFDGNGYSVTLQISGGDYAAMFASPIGATIKNLTVKGTVTATGGSTAGIAGAAHDVIIENCHNEATITSSGSYVGGIVGYAYDVDIKNCSNIADITGTADCVGGIVGRWSTNSSSTVPMIFEQNWSSGNIRANGKYAGGLMGASWKMNNRPVIIRNSYTTGTATAGSYVGTIGIYTKTSSVSETNGTGEIYGVYATKINVIYGRQTGAVAPTCKSYYMVGRNGVTIDTIEGLTSGTDEIFTDDTIWTLKAGFDYPQLVENPHK